MIDLALILAAGHGSRLRPHVSVPHKALVALAGEPLLARTCRQLAESNLQEIIIVTGHESQALRAALTRIEGMGARLRFVENRRWAESNGLSVLAASEYLNRPYLLMMADHLFDPTLLRAMANCDPGDGVVLAVDHKLDQIFDMDDATKVTVQEEFIVEIGKELTECNAVDTGLFACSGILVECLKTVEAKKGDCSLTDGMRWLAANRRLRGRDIHDSWWQDIDTPGALAHGADLLSRHRTESAGAPQSHGLRA